jgi:hypothetical protein
VYVFVFPGLSSLLSTEYRLTQPANPLALNEDARVGFDAQNDAPILRSFIDKIAARPRTRQEQV